MFHRFAIAVIFSVVALSACGSPSASKPAVSTCRPATFAGAGDDVIDAGGVGGCATAAIVAVGTGYFGVVPFDSDGERGMNLANENMRDGYTGTARWDATAHILEVDAPGAWTIAIK